MSNSSPRSGAGSSVRIAAAIAVLIAAALVSTASGARADVPKACSLLSRADASTLTGVPMLAADDAGSICTYNSDPNGPSAQVLIDVGTDTPRTMEIDRKLGHVFKSIAGLGDEAYEEDWNIFVRKGDVWVALSLVSVNEAATYAGPLQKAAALAISQLPAGSSSAGGSTAAPTGVVGKLPAGGGTNPLWKGNEKRFGGSIAKAAGVVYQPDVVLIGGGANAVRAVSADGLTWTLSGSAPGVSSLSVGKIMLATTLAAGRVLKVEPKGPNVMVTVGPVSLTDVIESGTFDSGGDVPVTQPLYYNQTLAVPPSGHKSRKTQSAADGTGTFTATPICCTSTGVAIGYDSPAGRMTAAVNLDLTKPTVNFHIVISGGKLKEVGLQLNGASSLDYHISAATKNVSGNVKGNPLPIPGAITIPLAGPLSLTLTQSFVTSLQLSGAAALNASGEYRLTGGLGFSYGTGSFHADATGDAAAKPLEYNVSSIGLGTNALSLGWAIKATVGIGFAGATAGAWFAFKSGLALAMDGSPGSPTQGCVTVGLSLTGQVGVGYTMPEYVLTVVNAIFKAIGAKPISADGGPQSSPFTIWQPKTASACPAKKP